MKQWQLFRNTKQRIIIKLAGGWGNWEKDREIGCSHSGFLDILGLQASDLVLKRITGISAEREITREGYESRWRMRLALF